MKKIKMGLVSATFLGITSIIGSGWLFAPYKTAQIAGPAAIYAWIIGALCIFFLALCFSEIAIQYPKRGLSAILATISHNPYFGFPFAIVNWLGIVAVIALEATATIQYLILVIPSIDVYLFHYGGLTWLGDICAILLILIYALTNYWGVRSLVKTNNILSVLKTIIPIVVALTIITVHFAPSNFTAVNHSFTPYGTGSIFKAIITTGIIIAFNGFQSVISFSSEIRNPRLTIPLSLMFCILFCLGVYLLLQVAFIGAMPADQLQHGWSAISMDAPIVNLAGLIGLMVLAPIIYLGAAVAPLGTAMAFVGASSRMFTAMSRNKQMPKFFDQVHVKYGISRRSLVFNIILSIGFLLTFKSWGMLAQILSIYHVISYMPVPIALVVFRYRNPNNNFKIPAGQLISFALFFIFCYLLTLSSEMICLDVIISLLIAQAVFIVSSSRSINDYWVSISRSFPVFLFLFLLFGLVYISPSNHNLLTGIYFAILVFIFSTLAFFCLVKLGLHRDHGGQYDDKMINISYGDGH